MATLEAALEADLDAYAALNAVMTGLRLDTGELDRAEWRMEDLPHDGDGRLQPFYVLRWGSSGPMPPVQVAERRFVAIHLYEDMGWVNIRAAKRLLKARYHRNYALTTDNEGLVWLNWIGHAGEDSAEELGGAPHSMVRFEIVTTNQ